MRSTEQPPTGWHWAIAAAFLVVSGFGCSGMVRTGDFNGACKIELAKCRSVCGEQREPRAQNHCENRCDLEARNCSKRQGEKGDDTIGVELAEKKRVTVLAEPVTQHVDFSTGRIDSNGPTVEARGAVRQAGDVFELMPGGALHVAFKVPANAREAELRLEHGAGGGGLPSFVTVSFGERPVLARYSAPRRGLDGALKVETFSLTPTLPSPDPKDKAKRALSLVIYNNAEAKSEAPYFLRRLELITRELGSP